MAKKKKGQTKREHFQCKKTYRGHKSKKGIPEVESEVKKPVGYSITPTAQEKFKDLARGRDSSASQLLEDISRQRYLLIPVTEISRIRKSLSPEDLETLDILIGKEDKEKEEQ